MKFMQCCYKKKCSSLKCNIRTIPNPTIAKAHCAYAKCLASKTFFHESKEKKDNVKSSDQSTL